MDCPASFADRKGVEHGASERSRKPGVTDGRLSGVNGIQNQGNLTVELRSSRGTVCHFIDLVHG